MQSLGKEHTARFVNFKTCMYMYLNTLCLLYQCSDIYYCLAGVGVGEGVRGVFGMGVGGRGERGVKVDHEYLKSNAYLYKGVKECLFGSSEQHL